MSDHCEACGQQTEYNGWPNYETWAVNAGGLRRTGNRPSFESGPSCGTSCGRSGQCRDTVLGEWLKAWMTMPSAGAEPANVFFRPARRATVGGRLGHDTDSRKAERAFKAVARQTENLRRFLGDDFETLLYRVERL